MTRYINDPRNDHPVTFAVKLIDPCENGEHIWSHSEWKPSTIHYGKMRLCDRCGVGVILVVNQIHGKLTEVHGHFAVGE